MELTGHAGSPPIARPVSLGTRMGWAGVIVAVAALFTVGTVALASIGPDSRPVDSLETFDVRLGAITAPEGWSVDIGSASYSQPRLHRDDVTVSTRTALWMGSTDDLLVRVADWFTPDGAVATFPDEAGEQSVITLSGEVEGQLVVVHRDSQVAIFTIRGPAQQLRTHQSDIDGIIDSLWFYDASPIEVDR